MDFKRAARLRSAIRFVRPVEWLLHLAGVAWGLGYAAQSSNPIQAIPSRRRRNQFHHTQRTTLSLPMPKHTTNQNCRKRFLLRLISDSSHRSLNLNSECRNLIKTFHDLEE